MELKMKMRYLGFLCLNNLVTMALMATIIMLLEKCIQIHAPYSVYG